MTAEAEPLQSAYPDLRDPRVTVAVPRDRRAALAALWALAERLTRLLRDAREPMIRQIKLAWWRDMMATLGSDPAALPKGEPLLAELQANWAGEGGLGALVDTAEAALLADSSAGRGDAARGFGAALFGLSGGMPAAGNRWGLVWGAAMQDDEISARDLLAAARAEPALPRHAFAGARALLMLDRWAGVIAKSAGERHWRREALILLRIGLIGR